MKHRLRDGKSFIKDHKRLLAGIMIFILMVFIGIFTWLWISNRKNADPLPIISSHSPLEMTDSNAPDMPISTLQLQAEESLQAALDEIIVIFKGRYANVQVLVRYMPTDSLLDLDHIPSPTSDNQSSVTQTDLIISNQKISNTQLSYLRTLVNDTNLQDRQNLEKHHNQNSSPLINTETNNNEETNSIAEDSEVRHLTTFSYAIKNNQAIEGIILTDNPVAISFRNLLLSTAGQDVLNNYGYDNIDGYKNSVDDLFNPESSNKRARGESSVKLTDALSSGD